jgi:5-formyltetrahydrofolate cyclo-ligase
MNMAISSNSKKKLRCFLREKRRNITLAQQKTLSAFVNHTLLQLPEFKKSKKIAAYLSQEMEIDLSLCIQQSWRAKKVVYLPVLNKANKHMMNFCVYEPNDPLTLNSVNILEPSCKTDRQIDPSKLDLILLPLVGFDPFGHRLGRGGGYYDAALSFCHQHKKTPTLIGIAYEFQKVDKIDVSKKDVDLHKVITEKKVYAF